MQQSTPIKIEITIRTIISVLVVLLSLWLMWDLKTLLFSLFMAFIVMSTARKPVSVLVGKKIPRKLAVAIVFVLLLIICILIVSWIAPLFIIETTLLVKHFPSIVSAVNKSIPSYLHLSLPQMLPDITNKFFSVLTTIFSNTVFLISTIFFSVYLTLEEEFVERIAAKFVDEKHAEQIQHLAVSVEKRLGSWLLGELTLMVVVGILTFIGLCLLGVKYALPLALIAGLLEAIPNLGPTLAIIPTFFVAFAQSPVLGFMSIALAFIIQQLENNIIVPIVMKRAVGLHPIITLIALIIGGRYGGVIGAFLAIPITLVIDMVVFELNHQVKR